MRSGGCRFKSVPENAYYVGGFYIFFLSSSRQMRRYDLELRHEHCPSHRLKLIIHQSPCYEVLYSLIWAAVSVVKQTTNY